MKTETPRTDAFNNTLGVVPADFARQIERELAVSKAEVERLKEDKMRLTAYCADLLEKINPSL